MNTMTQAPTGTAIKAQAQAIAKAPKAKPVTATETAPAWYAVYNARITAAKGELGSPLTAVQALAGTLIGGPEGRPKRTAGTAAEALWLALVLRPEGCTPGDYTTIKGSAGLAMNCLYHAGDVKHLRKGVIYSWVHVTTAANGARIARLTASGRAMVMRAGIKAVDADRMAKAYVAPTVKGDKPKAQPKAAKPRNGAAKATGKGDKPVATTPPATPPKPASEPAKPVAVPTASQGTPQVAPLAGMTPLGIKPQS